jgi:hypothetical protein
MPPEAGAPTEQSQEEGGGDVAAKVQKLDGDLGQFIEAALSSAEIPDSVKQKLSAVGEAWASALAELSGEGNGETEAVPEQGVSTPEQGNTGAMPMSMGRRG